MHETFNVLKKNLFFKMFWNWSVINVMFLLPMYNFHTKILIFSCKNIAIQIEEMWSCKGNGWADFKYLELSKY